MLLAGIYICNNRSPIKDFGDDVLPYNNEKLPIFQISAYSDGSFFDKS